MLILACEVLKPEMETLAREMENPPEMIFLSQRLHDYPDKLRQGIQEKIDEIENTRPDVDEIALGYGLCGKGLTGVTSRRVKLVLPRLHDCIPLYWASTPILWRHLPAKAQHTGSAPAGWIAFWLNFI